MKTLLVPINFEHAAEHALNYIESVFRGQDIKLELVHVIANDDTRSEEEIQQQFKKFETKSLFGFSVPYNFTVLRGNLVEEIQNEVHNILPSLVVIGSSGTALSKALIKLTDCPILVVPETSHKKKIRNIAYANDFHAVKFSGAFQPLLDLSQNCEAKVHIIHINKDETITEDDAEASLEYYLQLVDHEYASIKSENFVDAIQVYLRDQNIDVLSVLLRDHGNNNLSTRGKLIEELVSQTDIPVLSLV